MKFSQITITLSLLVAAPYLLHAKPSTEDNKQLYKTILQIDALLQYTPKSYTTMKNDLTVVENQLITDSFPSTLEQALDEILHNEKGTGYLDMLYKPKSVFSEKGLSKEEAFKIYEILKQEFSNKINGQPIDQKILKAYMDEVKEGKLKGTSVNYPTGALHIAREQDIKDRAFTSWQKRFAIIILRYLANKILPSKTTGVMSSFSATAGIKKPSSRAIDELDFDSLF
jgi:hypothetical protein